MADRAFTPFEKQTAENVPHVYRKKILIDWLPVATTDMANAAMQNLWNAWFTFVDPAGIQKPDCPKCVRNVLENWQALAAVLTHEEQEYNMLKSL